MLDEGQSRLAGGGFHDVVSPLLALLPSGPAHQALVVDDQNLLGRHAGLAYYGRGRIWEKATLHSSSRKSQPSPESINSGCLFHKKQSVGNGRPENIGVEKHNHADDGTQRHRVPSNKAKDNAFVAALLG